MMGLRAIGDQLSTSNELRVERPRLRDVIGPLDDRAAVGEDGELVPLGGEAEHVGVVADLADGPEPARQLGEVEGLGPPGGDLDGVPAAEGRRVRAEPPLEPREIATDATGAIDLAFQAGDLELPE